MQVTQFPVHKFKAKRGRRKKSDHTQIDCCYCKRKFKTGEILIQLPCKHWCHSHENYKWIYNETCNICITSVKRYFPVINNARRVNVTNELQSYLESRETTLNNISMLSYNIQERNIVGMSNLMIQLQINRSGSEESIETWDSEQDKKKLYYTIATQFLSFIIDGRNVIDNYNDDMHMEDISIDDHS